MRPYDMQSELLWEMDNLLRDPDLDTEELAHAVITIERFVDSGLITQTEAGELLAPAREGWG